MPQYIRNRFNIDNVEMVMVADIIRCKFFGNVFFFKKVNILFINLRTIEKAAASSVPSSTSLPVWSGARDVFSQGEEPQPEPCPCRAPSTVFWGFLITGRGLLENVNHDGLSARVVQESKATHSLTDLSTLWNRRGKYAPEVS